MQTECKTPGHMRLTTTLGLQTRGNRGRETRRPCVPMSHSGPGARGDLPCVVLCDGQGGRQALEDVRPSLMRPLGHLWVSPNPGPSSAQPRNQPPLPFPGLARVHLLEARLGAPQPDECSAVTTKLLSRWARNRGHGAAAGRV